MFDFLTRGTLMDEAGGADAGGGGLTMSDNGGSTGLATVGDTGGGEVLDAEVVEGDAGTDTDTDLEPYQVFEGRQPSKTTRAALGTLKATHPKVVQAIYKTLGHQQRLERVTGGADPVAVITGLQRQVQAFREAGLPFGIQEPSDVARVLKEIDELDNLFNSGDPRMVEQLTADPEGKANFVKLAPHFLKKLRELSPRLHDAHVARTVLATMDSPMFEIQTAAGVQKISATRAIERAIEYADQKIGDVANPVAPFLAIVARFINNLINIEQQQPEDLTPQQTGPDPRQAELDRRQKELDDRAAREKFGSWAKERDVAVYNTFRAEFAKQRKARGLKDGQAPEGEVFAIIESKVRAALTQRPGYKDKVNAYSKSDDKAGYVRLATSAYAELIPQKLSAYFDQMYGPIKRTPGTAQPQQRPGTQTVKPEQGFRAVNKRPQTIDFDINAMRTAGIINTSSGKGILREGNSFGLPAGTKVKWA